MREQVYSLQSAADSSLAERTGFIRRTYLHVVGAIAAFALLEVLIFKSGLDNAITSTLFGSQYSWLIVLGVFMGVSYAADRFAHSQTSEGAQYFGLGLFVVAQAIIFVPILHIANGYFEGAISTAAYITALLVIGLTSTVFISKKDFSFMGSFLKIGFFIGLGFILCSFIFGFSLGLVFSWRWDGLVGCRFGIIHDAEYLAPIPPWSACRRFLGPVLLDCSAFLVCSSDRNELDGQGLILFETPILGGIPDESFPEVRQVRTSVFLSPIADGSGRGSSR